MVEDDAGGVVGQDVRGVVEVAVPPPGLRGVGGVGAGQRLELLAEGDGLRPHRPVR